MYINTVGRLSLLELLRELDKKGEKALHIVPSFIEFRSSTGCGYVLEYMVVIDKK